MLIDSFATEWDVRALYSIHISASPQRVYDLLTTREIQATPIIRFLFFLRTLSMRRRTFTLQTLEAAGFGRLGDDAPREVVLGVRGRFWRFKGNISPFVREEFNNRPSPGTAVAVWNFGVSSADGQTVLSTETRVLCGDPHSRRRFRLYWFFVGPFSGVIRKEMLRSIRRMSEQPAGS